MSGCLPGSFALEAADGTVACVESCPRGFFAETLTGVCRQCRTACGNGFYADQSTCGGTADAECKACPTTCQLCSGPRMCSLCAEGFHLQRSTELNEQGMCVPCLQRCPEGQFVMPLCSNNMDNRCADCSVGCATCSDARSCDTCVEGFSLTSDKVCSRDAATTPDPDRSTGSSSDAFPAWAVAVIVIAVVVAAAAVGAVYFKTRRQSGSSDISGSAAPRRSSKRQTTSFENPSYMANNELEAQEGAISFDDFADDNFPRADDDDDDDDDGYTAGYSEVMGAH